MSYKLTLPSHRPGPGASLPPWSGRARLVALATVMLALGALLYVEQQGRRYIGRDLGCSAGSWDVISRDSLVRESFTQLDGPACTAGQSCPDFSATAPPIRLGFVMQASAANGAIPPGQTVHFAQGLDNWKVTVWRK